MLKIAIPGGETIDLKYLVLDYNGTIACDGILLPQIADRLNCLANLFEIYIVTADTFGHCQEQCKGINAKVHILKSESGTQEKQQLIAQLGPEQTVSIGNGTNDKDMLAMAKLGIAVLGDEGLSLEALQQAKIVVRDVKDALDLLLIPKRLIATMRR